MCVFNVVIMRTRLGQRFRAVGQNRAVANASGINVNRTRITAIVLSTVLAGLGQVIFLQNFGAMQTYNAHEQVGLYAGAAILVAARRLSARPTRRRFWAASCSTRCLSWLRRQARPCLAERQLANTSAYSSLMASLRCRWYSMVCVRASQKSCNDIKNTEQRQKAAN